MHMFALAEKAHRIWWELIVELPDKDFNLVQHTIAIVDGETGQLVRPFRGSTS